MQITLNFRVQIHPDEQARQILFDTMRAYRDACNYVSSFVFSSQSMDLKTMQENLYYDLRSMFGLRSQMAISVLRTVRKCYKSCDAQRNEWALIKFKKPQLDLLWNRDYSITKGLLSINTLGGRIKVPFDKNMSPPKGRFGTAYVYFRHNKIYLNIPVTQEVSDVCLSEIGYVVGVDRGIRFLATTYDSDGKTTFFSGADYRNKRNHYHQIRQQLRQKGTPSSKKRLKAIAERENRWINDLNHCISKALVEAYPKGTLFVLEDLLHIQSASARLYTKEHYALTTWPYLDFEIKLMYKAAIKGQKVIKVPPAYTSQRCPLCGRRDKRSRNKEKHLFRCFYCRYKTNDDRVAALNLYDKGMKYLVQSGESMPLFGGARSIVPNAMPVLEAPFSRTNPRVV